VLAHVISAQKHGMSLEIYLRSNLFWFGEAHRYPQDIDSLATSIGKPNLAYMTLVCIADQIGMSPDELSPIQSKISVFHSAIATFFSPSNPSGIHGMWYKHIQSTPSWRGHKKQHDCAFIIEDNSKPGVAGMGIVRVMLFFSF
jgi:hypothetical protein